MSSVADIEILANRMVADLGSGPRIIGIDGVDGVGKTPLANLVGSKLGVPVISLDSYLIKDRNCYVGALDDTLVRVVQAIDGGAVIEGVCLLAAAKRFSFEVDTLVYLKRVHLGLWADEDCCEFDDDPIAIIAKEEEQLFAFQEWDRGSRDLSPPLRAEVKLSGLRSELIRYHGKYRPHRISDFVYEVEHA